jgi:hypothetical protein
MVSSGFRRREMVFSRFRMRVMVRWYTIRRREIVFKCNTILEEGEGVLLEFHAEGGFGCSGGKPFRKG